MAVTRRVHRFEGGGDSTSPGHVPDKGWVGASPLENGLNKRLVNGERIVGTHYVDGHWIIITENYGLGPKGA